MRITAVNAADKICTVVDEEGKTQKVPANQLKVEDKKYRAKEGNPTELTTQGDGATVAIKESKEEGYVRAVVSVSVSGFPANTEVQVKALDYTSKGDNESIDIILPNKKLASVKKSDIKLFEAGVYNSETDINNNPKTDENKPDKLTGKMDVVLDGIENILASVQELKTHIEDETSFSSESLDTCIAELTTYKNNLAQEKTLANSASVSA